MNERNLTTILEPNSQVAESFRILRTNLQFSAFEKKIKIVVVTSSFPGEGKSTVCSNLAIVMSENGFKTVLVDCDQRNAEIHKLFNLKREKGLSDLLVGSFQLEEILHKTNIKNLHIITAGTKPPNPSVLISSTNMKNLLVALDNDYDYIILDTPPVLAVTDAQLLSAYADGCILVVASSEIEKNAAVKAKELLRQVDARLLGVVLNKVAIKRHDKSRYYYHSSDE